MGIKTHKGLNIWKDSVDLVVNAYNLTKGFPEYEKFGLSSQMQRSAVSIPSNIAEGAARNSTKEFINYLHIALGSLSELETQLIISFKLNYLDRDKFFKVNEKIEAIRKQLLNFIKCQKEKLKNDQTK